MRTLNTVILFGLLSLASGVRHIRSSLRTRKTSLKKSTLAKSGTMAAMYPFYHTSDDLHDKLGELAQRCPALKIDTREGDGVSIDIASIKSGDDEKTNKMYILFGEHSRELISPESGFHLIQSLCGETDLTDQAKEVLKDTEFRIVVNGNPNSRRKVETGDFCLRVNENGVDLNRNWDEKWEPQPELDAADTNPGPKPFSEPETQIFKDTVSEFDPTTFLTIHSGTKGMYMPWAFDMEHLADRNEPAMMQMLKTLDDQHCQCPFGAAGKEVGYPCPGTCLDWVYDQLKTPYSFAFEIYTSPDYDESLRERWQEKMQSGPGAFYQQHSHLAHKHFKDIFEKHPSCFVQLKDGAKHRAHHRGFGMSESECFAQFNPENEEEFNSVRKNWSKAYLDLAQLVVANIKAGGSTKADPASAIVLNGQQTAQNMTAEAPMDRSMQPAADAPSSILEEHSWVDKIFNSK